MKTSKIFPYVLVTFPVLLAVIMCMPAHAAADEIMNKIQMLKARIEKLEKKILKQEVSLQKQDRKIQEQNKKIVSQAYSPDAVEPLKSIFKKFDWYIGATSVVQGTINNDRNAKKVPGLSDEGDDADATWSVDIMMSTKIGEHGTAGIYIMAGEGEGLNSEAGGLTLANTDATGDDADMEIVELWYQHNFLDDKLEVTVGKIDLWRWFDRNEVANDETCQFLSWIFVDNIAINWPDNWFAYGGRVGWRPNDLLEFNAGLVEADGDFEDLFDNNLMIAQVSIKPQFGNLRGNYHFYCWRNTAEHQKLRDLRRDDKSAAGFGMSFDQQLSERITAFLRYGQQNDDIFAVKSSWSFGFQVAGSLWGRQNDMFGLAFGQARTGGDYRRLLRDEGFGPANAESRLEAYYRYRVNEHLVISPDLQWVDGLAGSSHADPVTILGVRAQLDY